MTTKAVASAASLKVKGESAALFQQDYAHWVGQTLEIRRGKYMGKQVVDNRLVLVVQVDAESPSAAQLLLWLKTSCTRDVTARFSLHILILSSAFCRHISWV